MILIIIFLNSGLHYLGLCVQERRCGASELPSCDRKTYPGPFNAPARGYHNHVVKNQHFVIATLNATPHVAPAKRQQQLISFAQPITNTSPPQKRQQQLISFAQPITTGNLPALDGRTMNRKGALALLKSYINRSLDASSNVVASAAKASGERVARDDLLKAQKQISQLKAQLGNEMKQAQHTQV